MYGDSSDKYVMNATLALVSSASTNLTHSDRDPGLEPSKPEPRPAGGPGPGPEKEPPSLSGWNGVRDPAAEFFFFGATKSL